MKKKQIAVSDLRIGMYVVELDRPWLGTPFPFQGFPLTNGEQINSLQAYCTTVFVDPEREEWSADTRAGADDPLKGSVLYREVTPVEAEVVIAKDVYKSCEDAIQQSLVSLRVEGQIDVQKLTGAVKPGPVSFSTATLTSPRSRAV